MSEGSRKFLHRLKYPFIIVWILAFVFWVSCVIINWTYIVGKIQHVFGFCKTCGDTPQYLFYSGAGSNLTYIGMAFGILTTAYHLWKRFNCHEPWCLRVGRIHVDDKGTLSCYHHHPDGKPKPGHIQRTHQAHQARMKIDNQDPRAT